MLEFKKNKIFKDPIHNYIEIPDLIVKGIVDTELFQRLRFIEQTNMRSLYPAARHDRFIHSLGVYWLGRKAFSYFRKNAEKVMYEQGDKSTDKVWWDKQELLFNIACLLHDCAHAPFSHTLEEIYELKTVKYIDSSSKKECESYLLDLELLEICKSDHSFQNDFLCENTSSSPDIPFRGKGAPHEKLSALMVMQEYKDTIKEIVPKLLNETYLNKLKNDELKISDEDCVFIVRAIIGCIYSKTDKTDNTDNSINNNTSNCNNNDDDNSNSLKNSLKNCMISMLNSSSIDVDGLDYIVRDAYMSGMDNFSIDYQRLLTSFTIIPVECFEKFTVGSDYDISGIWLKDSTFSVIKISKLDMYGNCVFENVRHDKERIRFINNKKGDAVFAIESSENIQEITIEKVISSDTNIEITLRESCRIDSGKVIGEITGKRIVLKGINSKRKRKKNQNPLEYILGYEKNSLSIIQSTVEARNHEYLWVYSHPKVLYNSNYLQVEMMKDSAHFLCCMLNHDENDNCILQCSQCNNRKNFIESKKEKDEILKKTFSVEDYILYILGYKSYFDEERGANFDFSEWSLFEEKGYFFNRTNDDDLNALFKRIYIENEKMGSRKSEKISREFKEYFSRKQRKVLWKSFVEYEKFINQYDHTGVLVKLKDDVCSRNDTVLIGNSYGIPNEEQMRIFERIGMKNVLFLETKVKTKEINPANTFIVFSDSTVRLCDVLEKEILKETMKKEFFYIFFDAERDLSSKEKRKLIEKLEDYCIQSGLINVKEKK